MDRRGFASLVGGALAGLVGGRALADTPPARRATAAGPERPADDAPFRIGMIVFDRMTNLDFVGPCDLFARVRQAQVHILAATTAPVTTDSGCRIIPQQAFAEAPPLDLLFVGGGPGVNALMEDAATLAFLRARAPAARWVTSVCTGALVLGAAGLLRGYRAATHWAAMDVLPVLGAEPVHQRVVVDRNRITGGGVTAGLDFGLEVIAQVWGREQAELVQLGAEYDPHPPFNAGSPATAPAAILDRSRAGLAALTQARIAAAHRAMARL